MKNRPFSQKTIIRLLCALVVSLAILAGYFQTLYQAEAKKYLRIEDRYVRVRSFLGREETQRILDLSYSEDTIQ